MTEINLDNKPEQERCPLCGRWFPRSAGEAPRCPHCGAGGQYFRKEKEKDKKQREEK